MILLVHKKEELVHFCVHNCAQNEIEHFSPDFVVWIECSALSRN